MTKSVGETAGETFVRCVKEYLEEAKASSPYDWLIHALSNLSSEDLEEVINKASDMRYQKLIDRVGDVFRVNNNEDSYWVCMSHDKYGLYGINYTFSGEIYQRSSINLKLPDTSLLTQVDAEVLINRMSRHIDEYRNDVLKKLALTLKVKNKSEV